MAVVVTVGTNSYVSVVDCTAYLAERLYTELYTAAAADTKSQAVIMATRAIDRMVLTGRKKTITQALEFPRCYVYDTRYGNPASDLPVAGILDDGWYCEAAVPQGIIDACCEEALAILTAGNSKRLALQKQGVTAFSLGNLSETYGGTGINSSTKPLLSVEALALMRPYREGAVTIR